MYINSVLITGASKGFGLEMVREFLFDPNPPEHLFVTYQYDENTRELELLQQIYPQLKIFQHNIPMEAKYKELREFVEGYVGEAGLNLLINNSEFYENEPEQFFRNTRSLSMNKMQYYFLMNATSPLLLIKELYPLLKKATLNRKFHTSRVSAAVVNMSSLLGTPNHFTRVSGALTYKVSKAALNFITQCAAKELLEQGILVIGLHPGIRDFHSSVFETPEVIRDLAGKCVSLIREFEEEHYVEGKIYTPSGISFLLRPITLRAML